MYVNLEGTVHPIDVPEDDGDSVQWILRYAPDRFDRHLFAASILAAYAALLDPNITQGDAIAKLKRARKARAQVGAS